MEREVRTNDSRQEPYRQPSRIPSNNPLVNAHSTGAHSLEYDMLRSARKGTQLEERPNRHLLHRGTAVASGCGATNPEHF